MSGIYPRVKRALDFTLAAVGLAVLSPLVALTALAVRLMLGAPVIFRQPRPGLHERIFDCLKFRTMTSATGPDGELLPDPQRQTRFGRFLRATSLDELPQLWSVLRGDMSLVGPRPLMVNYLPRYNATQRRRHLVRPGITGWAQINGRNAIDWPEKLAMDVWYVDHQSFRLDLEILVRTFIVVLTGSGVARPGQVSMDEFLGDSGTERTN